MTRKQFKALAKALANVRPMIITPTRKRAIEAHLQAHSTWADCCRAVETTLADQFPNFNREKFRDACLD